jgi:hypothetical protein
MQPVILSVEAWDSHGPNVTMLTRVNLPMVAPGLVIQISKAVTLVVDTIVVQPNAPDLIVNCRFLRDYTESLHHEVLSNWTRAIDWPGGDRLPTYIRSAR